MCYVCVCVCVCVYSFSINLGIVTDIYNHDSDSIIPIIIKIFTLRHKTGFSFQEKETIWRLQQPLVRSLWRLSLLLQIISGYSLVLNLATLKHREVSVYRKVCGSKCLHVFDTTLNSIQAKYFIVWHCCNEPLQHIRLINVIIQAACIIPCTMACF